MTWTQRGETECRSLESSRVAPRAMHQIASRYIINYEAVSRLRSGRNLSYPCRPPPPVAAAVDLHREWSGPIIWSSELVQR